MAKTKAEETKKATTKKTGAKTQVVKKEKKDKSSKTKYTLKCAEPIKSNSIDLADFVNFVKKKID